MQAEQWKLIEYFTPGEAWGIPRVMDYGLIRLLDRLRGRIGKPIIIHCGYELRDGQSFHSRGLAVDCHAEGMHLIDFFLAAGRYDFGGIGLYPFWRRPGLHLDVRPGRATRGRALWACTGPKQYRPLDSGFLKTVMDLPGMIPGAPEKEGLKV